MLNEMKIKISNSERKLKVEQKRKLFQKAKHIEERKLTKTARTNNFLKDFFENSYC